MVIKIKVQSIKNWPERYCSHGDDWEEKRGGGNMVRDLKRHKLIWDIAIIYLNERLILPVLNIDIRKSKNYVVVKNSDDTWWCSSYCPFVSTVTHGTYSGKYGWARSKIGCPTVELGAFCQCPGGEWEWRLSLSPACTEVDLRVG